MNTPILYAAAAASLLTFSVHFFVGGRFVAAPLLADTNLPRGSKWLNYYTWHTASIYLFVLIGVFVWAGWNQKGMEMIVLVTLLNSLFGVLSAVVALRGNIAPWRFPSTTLFGALSILGLLALML